MKEQVKIFYGHLLTVEEEINSWLNNNNIQIIRTNQSGSSGSDGYGSYVMISIFYQDIEVW